MKRIYSVILFTVLTLFSQAATTVVGSSGLTFSPANITINVGDTVQFNIGGSHNVVEVSMATYNANGTTSNGGFSLPFGGGTLTGLGAGTYYFVCTPHASAGMKGTITVNAAPPSGCDLLISGAFDGPLSGGIPKLMELYVVNNIPDLSIYGVSSANNGTGPTGSPEFTFPAVAATAGDYIYLSTDSTSVNAYFGFFPDYTDGFMSINGDDALELFQNGTVVDVFGDVNCDPNAGGTTCPGWEYLDGWAYRNNGNTCSPTFTEADWTYSGANANDGQTMNSSAPNPFPVGTYQLVATPKMNIETPAFTMNEGDPTTIVTRLIVNPTLATASSIEIHLVGGNGSAADLDLTAFGGGPFPLTIPVAANADTLTVPITPLDDAVYEGTETFDFVIRNPTGGLNLGNDTTFMLTMTDNELPPDTTVNANPTMVTADEGAGTVDLTFDIGQLSAGGTTFTVDLQLNSGNAADIGGYTTQTISFPSTGTTTETVTITITDDALVEGNEMFIFELVNPSTGLTLGTSVLDTLMIVDNDFSTYPISLVTTLDSLGSPDSLGVACEVAGVVMGINYADGPDISFYFHDGTGGMGLYNSTSVGYTVNEGDQVTIQGEVGFFNGLTQMVNIDTIIVTGTGTLPAVIPTTTPLGEGEEGELISLSNVTVVDQTDWNTGAGSGFNVEVTDGTNTYSVRIDKSADLFNMALPGCVLDVTGIGTQFDNSSPYTSGYQMLPRYASDITVIDPCMTVSVTIEDATEVDANGEPLMAGTDVVLKGIITSPDFRELQSSGTEFSFSDGTGGIWAYSTDSTISFDPIVGDSVEVMGNIGGSFGGVTRLYIDAVTSLGAATPFTPSVVTTALDESHEGELITLENLTISSGTWETSGGSYNLDVSNSNGTYSVRVDADRAELFAPILSGSETFNLTGIGTQFDNSAPQTEGYEISPRFDSDIEIVSGVKEIELANFSVSPVPASEVLTVQFDFDASEVVTARLINVIGQASLSQEFNVVKGSNAQSLNVQDLNAGFYVLQIETSKGTSNTSVLLK